MKVNVTFDFNPLDHDTLKDLLGKTGRVPIEEYRSIIKELVHQKLRTVRTGVE